MKPSTDLSRLLAAVRAGYFIIIDTETTDKYPHTARVVQFAAIESSGQILLNTLVNPTVSITNSFIHGITDDMVKDAPTFRDVASVISETLKDRTVIVYNTDYDIPLLQHEFKRVSMDAPLVRAAQCAMKGYAEYVGEWNEYFGNYTFQKLTSAAKRARYTLPQGIEAHSALGDCLMALAVCRFLAEKVKS